MIECLQLMHTFKGREQTLEYVKSLSGLDSPKNYTYKINHQYDMEPTDIYVKTSIQPTVFELLLAHILFEASLIDECYALCQEEIAQPILNGLYDVKVSEQATEYNEIFDLYYVWEKWCALFDKVMDLEVLKRDSLREELEKIIPKEY